MYHSTEVNQGPVLFLITCMCDYGFVHKGAAPEEAIIRGHGMTLESWNQAAVTSSVGAGQSSPARATYALDL